MEEIRFRITDTASTLSRAEIDALIAESAEKLEICKKGETCYSDSQGWLNVDEWAGDEWLSRYEELAKEVQENADALVVIGIGGSNQAARAVYEALNPNGKVELIWGGNSISPHSLSEVLASLKEKRVYIDVIAKNFETLEPGISFRVFRDYLKAEYGDTYNSHVICTGTDGSQFDDICKKHGFRFLPFPKNIGGRFTALSPIGLFPLAVAGVNIRKIAAGAKHMEQRLKSDPAETNMALEYAAVRNLLYRKGFRVEMLSFFEPRFFRFGKWWDQLFGESEGKDDTGLFPTFCNFSEDLHSLGQFIQSGTKVIFETFLNVQKRDHGYTLHDDEVTDGFHYLDNKDFWDINKAAFEATVSAHGRRFPCLILDVPAIDEETFGQLFYFFEFACYVSGKILGVNPFDQPGVEAYKNDMFKILGK